MSNHQLTIVCPRCLSSDVSRYSGKGRGGAGISGGGAGGREGLIDSIALVASALVGGDAGLSAPPVTLLGGV